MQGVLEKPKEPVKWPAYVFYFKPVLVLLNIVPFALFLVLYARVLDRYALERLGLVLQPVRPPRSGPICSRSRRR